jgi:succinate dehydrogenase/fumarate reductase cytochrome b subunit
MEITGLFGFLIFVADIWAILKIIKSSASDGKKALWIAIVVVLPLIGLILWYLMGPGKPD